MSRRLELHELLAETLGSRNVYFQPPDKTQMKYPCVVYSRSRINTKHADNRLYSHNQAYTVTVIGPDPDSSIVDKVLKLPHCRPDRHFTSDNLNHDVFTIYY